MLQQRRKGIDLTKKNLMPQIRRYVKRWQSDEDISWEFVDNLVLLLNKHRDREKPKGVTKIDIRYHMKPKTLDMWKFVRSTRKVYKWLGLDYDFNGESIFDVNLPKHPDEP